MGMAASTKAKGSGEKVVTVKPIGKFFDFLNGPAAKVPTVLLYGGAGSGKSKAIIQQLVHRCLFEKKYTVMVMRKYGPSLTASAQLMFVDTLGEYGLREGKEYEFNKAERRIRFKNGNVAWFRSLDSPEKIKSLNITDLYLEEGNEFTFADYEQALLRCRLPTTGRPNQVFITCNPTDITSWVKTKISDRADGRTIIVHHSTYRDNPFLPAQARENIEGLKDYDAESYRMFGLGEWVSPSNVIFTNFTVQPIELREPTSYGLDFGFNNPTALVALEVRDGVYHLKELLFMSHLNNTELIERLKQVIPQSLRERVPVYCDSAEPARIDEIRRAGFYALPAVKDVKAGILRLKAHRLVLDGQNIEREMRGYHWRQDKNSVVLDEPAKVADHTCDAARYACSSLPMDSPEGPARDTSAYYFSYAGSYR